MDEGLVEMKRERDVWMSGCGVKACRQRGLQAIIDEAVILTSNLFLPFGVENLCNYVIYGTCLHPLPMCMNVLAP